MDKGRLVYIFLNEDFLSCIYVHEYFGFVGLVYLHVCLFVFFLFCVPPPKEKRAGQQRCFRVGLFNKFTCFLLFIFVYHLQKKDRQASEDEHEEVGKEEGAATVLET